MFKPSFLRVLKFRFRRAGSDAKRTFFLHIPKCAGSTLWEVLWDIYGTRHVLMVNSQRHHARFAAMPLERRLSYSAIGGHGSLKLFCSMLGDTESYHKIVTLRDPVDRAISLYNYVRTRPQHPRNRIVAPQSFEEFIETTAQPNRQVRLLTGRGDDVDGAVEVVQRFFDDWSLSNDVEQMVERLYQVTNTTPRPTKHKNKATSSFSRRDLPPATLRLVEQKNRHDLALIETLRRSRAQ